MSGASKGDAAVRPTLHHVNLKTTRLGEMIDWYGTVVGMDVHHRFPGGAWLSNDDANHRLALLASPQFVDHPDKLAHTGITWRSSIPRCTICSTPTCGSRTRASGRTPPSTTASRPPSTMLIPMATASNSNRTTSAIGRGPPCSCAPPPHSRRIPSGGTSTRNSSSRATGGAICLPRLSRCRLSRERGTAPGQREHARSVACERLPGPVR